MTRPGSFRVDVENGDVSALAYEADVRQTAAARGACLILAHGAGGNQRSPFMVAFADAVAALGVHVVTFNFPYSEARRRLPDRRPVLERCYRAVVNTVRQRFPSAAHLFIGGKSMGGRIASHLATEAALDLSGLVLLGYPLHPPGRPSERRDAHLPSIACPVFIAQGSRDTFGTPDEIAPAFARTDAMLHVVANGDHSFKLSRGGAPAQAAVLDDVQRTMVEWMAAVMLRRGTGRLLR